VQQIGAHASADVGPALRQVAEQPRPGRPPERRVVEVHLNTKPGHLIKVPSLSAAILSEIFTQGLVDLSLLVKKTAEIRHFFKLARALLQ
jgi:hypothetical protein